MGFHLGKQPADRLLSLPRCCAHPWLQLLQLEGGVSGNPARWQHAHADMSVTNSHENITATAAQSVPSSNGWEVKNWESPSWRVSLLLPPDL